MPKSTSEISMSVNRDRKPIFGSLIRYVDSSIRRYRVRVCKFLLLDASHSARFEFHESLLPRFTNSCYAFTIHQLNMTTSAQTPMLRQYQELKQQHPGTLLF